MSIRDWTQLGIVQPIHYINRHYINTTNRSKAGNRQLSLRYCSGVLFVSVNISQAINYLGRLGVSHAMLVNIYFFSYAQK